jgi:hypothetical protein
MKLLIFFSFPWVLLRKTMLRHASLDPGMLSLWFFLFSWALERWRFKRMGFILGELYGHDWHIGSSMWISNRCVIMLVHGFYCTHSTQLCILWSCCRITSHLLSCTLAPVMESIRTFLQLLLATFPKHDRIVSTSWRLPEVAASAVGSSITMIVWYPVMTSLQV